MTQSERLAPTNFRAARSPFGHNPSQKNLPKLVFEFVIGFDECFGIDVG